MKYLEVLLFVLGILILFLYAFIQFMMQVYLLNSYWICLLILSIFLIRYYLKNNTSFIKRLCIYVLVVVNVFSMYGFGTFCKGLDAIVFNFGEFCLNAHYWLDFYKLLTIKQNIIHIIQATIIFVSLGIIELAFRLKNERLSIKVH